MFIKSFVSITAAAALLVSAQGVSAQNLLVNPGFEADVLAPLTDTPGATGWEDLGNAFTRFQSPRSGDNALKTFGQGGVAQTFAAGPVGTVYKASAYALNPSFDQMAGSQIGVVNIEWFDAGMNFLYRNGTTIVTSESTPGDSEGGTVDVYSYGEVFDVVQAGSAFARIVLFTGPFGDPELGAAGGAVYFDDASFSVVPEPASLALLGVGGLMMVGRRRRRAH